MERTITAEKKVPLFVSPTAPFFNYLIQFTAVGKKLNKERERERELLLSSGQAHTKIIMKIYDNNNNNNIVVALLWSVGVCE